MPRIGLGTWQITDRVQMAEIVESAYQSGYRLIDTAAAYSNEIALAKALAAAEIKRTKMFLSDKVWNTSRGAAAVQEACRKSLKKLKTEYLDLYLIHWPASMKLYPDWAEVNADTWRGMEQLYKDGLVRAIGVCNFKEHHLTALEKTAAGKLKQRHGRPVSLCAKTERRPFSRPRSQVRRIQRIHALYKLPIYESECGRYNMYRYEFPPDGTQNDNGGTEHGRKRTRTRGT